MPGTTMIEDQRQEDKPEYVAAAVVVLRDIGYVGCSIVLTKAVRGVDRTSGTLYHPVSLRSKVFLHFMRKHCTKFFLLFTWGRITPLTPSMLEVVTALAAEEEHSTSPSSRAASSARDAQGSPTQSVAHSQRYLASVQGSASLHKIKTLRSKREEERRIRRKVYFSQNGEIDEKKKRTLSEEHNVQEEVQQILFFDDIADQMLLVTPDWKEKKYVIPKDKGQRIIWFEEPKKKKLTLQQIRALETTNDEEVARKIQAEWDAEEERKRLEEMKKAKPKTTSLAQERNQMMNFLKGQGYKNLQKLKYPQMKELYDKVQESIKDSFKDFIPMGSEKEREMLKERETKRLLRKRKATISEEQPSKKLKLRTETVDEIRNYLRIVDFEKSAQDKESLEGISMITELQVIDSPDGQYLIIHRANNHFRAFDTLWEILHILDRQDLQHLYRVVQSYFEHIPPTGLGLILLGDLTTIFETSDDDFWKNQKDWEIIRWRLNESSGVHTLELEDGTMIHMLAERRYPLSRELMIRMLDHGMEVEDESEIAITLIHLFILWTTEDGDNP
ncbi:hypothetical protein Tco_1294990 [Tanacetum coccineum]